MLDCLDVHIKFDASGHVIREPMTPWEYARTQPAVILHYLQLCFWPQGQCLEPMWAIATTAGAIVPPLLVILALLGATVWCVFRRPAWGFLGGWFFVILAPTSSIAPIVNLEFEHRMYLSLAAVATAVVFAGHKTLSWIASRSVAFQVVRHRFAAMVLAIAVATLGCTTFARNEAYSSEIAIWQDVIEHSPLPSYHAYQSIGKQLALQNDLHGAVACYDRALESGENKDVFSDLGRVYMRLGERYKARACFNCALQMDPNMVAANVNLANLLHDDDPEEAIRCCRVAIEKSPENAKAHDTLANLLEQQGRIDEALSHHRLAVKHDPEYATAHNNLGSLLARLGRLDEALSEYEAALSIDPDFREAQQNLDLVQRKLAAQRDAHETRSPSRTEGAAISEQGTYSSTGER